jgi:hypothetical protein
LSDRFTPDIEADRGNWIVLAPRTEPGTDPNSQDNALSLPELRDPIVFRRDEPDAPAAVLETADKPERWIALTITAEGHVVGRAVDGREYDWPLFADRKALIDFARAHLPLQGKDPVELSRRDRCLVGLAVGEECLNALPLAE